MPALRAISTVDATSPPRVGSRRVCTTFGSSDRREHRGHQSVQWRAVGGHRGAEVDALAHAHDRHAVLADVARHDDVIAGARLLGPDAQPVGHHADAGGVDEKPVRTALSDDLGVAGDDADAGVGGGLAHRLRDGTEHLELEALLEDEAGRQRQRLRPAHRQVVDGAVDGQITDVAAREEQRVDHVGVGGQRDAAGRRRRARAESRDGPPEDPNAGRNRFSISSSERMPPPPWPSTMRLVSRSGSGHTQSDGSIATDRVRHAPPFPACGTGSRPHTRPRWTPWWRPTGCAACRSYRTPGTGWA